MKIIISNILLTSGRETTNVVKTGQNMAETGQKLECFETVQKSDSCDTGFVAMANGILIRRTLSYDDDNVDTNKRRRLCKIIDRNNLEELEVLQEIPEMALGPVS